MMIRFDIVLRRDMRRAHLLWMKNIMMTTLGAKIPRHGTHHTAA
ncbi:hypothetical protein HMPREF9162_0405 [Selenomonas sp. oral taxon 137 str. F0430]|nr:hypothetical protein HMPREF9162_0405 [Selenomonas sp. oral taxon 137 str. F0430]